MRIEPVRRGKRTLQALLLFASVIAAVDAGAIPLFGRKFNTTCFSCHVSEPMLNEFGRRFQANGYAIPGSNDKTPVWDQSAMVLSFIASPSFSFVSEKDNLTGETMNSKGFGDIGFDILSSGGLGSNLGYFGAIVVDPAGDGKYEAAVEAMYFTYRNLFGGTSGNVNARIGKLRLLTPFPGNLSISQSGDLATEYNPEDVYGAGGNPTSGELLLQEPQFAFSLFGWVSTALDGLRYEIAYTSGTHGDVNLEDSRAIYVALNQTVFVESAPFRIGAFYYAGSQNVDTSGTGVLEKTSNTLSRFGIDAELYDPWTKRINLTFQYIIGKDDKIFDGTSFSKLKMTGGFVGLTAVLKPEKFYAYGRYDFRNIDELQSKENQITIGLRHHFMPNVYAFAELSSGTVKIPALVDTRSTTINFGTAFGF